MKLPSLLLSFATLLSSCSVVMASNRGGSDVETIQGLHTRTQLIAAGAEPVDAEKQDDGSRIETFTVLKEHGSVARAFMHGLLDLGTGFIWELAGTPIESALNEKKYFSLKVTFDAEDQIQKMELH